MKTKLRTVVLGMAIAAMTGCNSLSSNALQTMKVALTGPDSQITVDRVRKVDGSVLLAKLGVAQAMLVTNMPLKGQVEWYGVTEMILTDAGRVTQTAGFSYDVISPLDANDLFRTGLLSVSDGLEVTRLVDYPTQYMTGVSQTARYKRGPLETVTFMGQQHQLQRIDERIHIPELNFSATNYYWIDPDSGIMRRSIQHISPDLPPLHLTLVQMAGVQP